MVITIFIILYKELIDETHSSILPIPVTDNWEYSHSWLITKWKGLKPQSHFSRGKFPSSAFPLRQKKGGKRISRSFHGGNRKSYIFRGNFRNNRGFPRNRTKCINLLKVIDKNFPGVGGQGNRGVRRPASGFRENRWIFFLFFLYWIFVFFSRSGNNSRGCIYLSVFGIENLLLAGWGEEGGGVLGGGRGESREICGEFQVRPPDYQTAGSGTCTRISRRMLFPDETSPLRRRPGKSAACHCPRILPDRHVP